GRGSPALEISGDAAVVPVARRPEERSALARPHHRVGKSSLHDLSDHDLSNRGRARHAPVPSVPALSHIGTSVPSTRCPHGWRSRTMRTTTAYFAGVGTVVAAVAVGLGSGLLISNIVSPHEPKTEMS